MSVFDNYSCDGQMSIFDIVDTDKHVERITYQDAKPFIMNIHYARRMPCIQYAFGLKMQGRLIGVVTYGQPASPTLCKGVAGEEHRKQVLELNRLVILPQYNGDNLASYLVGKSLKLLPHGTFVVSYADWGGVASCRICLSSDKLALYGINQTKNRQIFRKRTFKALYP